jgi:hypothetical protein
MRMAGLAMFLRPAPVHARWYHVEPSAAGYVSNDKSRPLNVPLVAVQWPIFIVWYGLVLGQLPSAGHRGRVQAAASFRSFSNRSCGSASRSRKTALADKVTPGWPGPVVMVDGCRPW